MRYAIAAKFVPDHDGHDERWCSYCEAFEDGYEVAEARADVDGLATPEGYAERYATGYEAGRKDAARDIRRAVMKLAYTTVDVTDTSEGWEAVPRASVLALVAPLLAGDKAEASLLTVGVDDTLLVKLSEDDIMYDHPVSSMHEPADPVLFVRWDAILALLHPSAGDKAEAPE